MANKIAFQGDSRLRWVRSQGCVITYIEAEQKLSDRNWDAWLAALDAASGDAHVIGAWGDIQPSKDQWKRLTRLLSKRKLKVAVLTGSKHTSAMTKAASWLGVEIQAFGWDQSYDAGVFLGLDQQQRMAARVKLTALRDAFGAVATEAEFVARKIPSASAERAPSNRPMAENASRNLEDVRRTSEEIQARLAEIQARLRGRQQIG